MPLASIPKREEEILAFWQNQKIFKKSVEKPAKRGDFVFFDGPPFATGTPHYGHIVASLMKDAVPRYFTMKGYRVERRWGWDCHGLPIENIVEEELKSASKKELEEKVGVAAFDELCRSKVLRYADEWKKFIPRMGRWADMDNPYKTMDLQYMESVWWAFKTLYDKGLIYEGHKSMHICPRCETTLSQSEVSQGYKDIADISVVAKFPLKDEPGTSLLAWTTTPWTLPGNVALAIGKDITYAKIKIGDKNYILAQDTIPVILKETPFKKVAEFKGEELVGKEYEPLFSYFAEKIDPSQPPLNTRGGKGGLFRVYPADFVAISEGSGIVHIAPAFGQDDLNLGKQYGLPFLQHVDFSGRFTPEVKDFAGMQVKPVENPKATDAAVVAWLEHHDKLFSQAEYTHSYPHCWRCDTPLLNYAASSWFVNVTKVKPRLLELAKNISWVPEYIKEGRFGNWLEGALDWSISRQRFWGSVIPIWKCDGQLKTQNSKLKTTTQNCKTIKVVGSIAELEQLSGKKVTDLHKHIVDEITFPCEKCGGVMRRIPDVLDCWFESASMPYAQLHYPFENKEKFDKSFPADFIAEGVDQTRCWFYYMLLVSVMLMDKEPFRHVIANGIVLAEDGQKMSKHLKNYPDPTLVIDKYGADALRYYLLTSPVMKAENLCFAEKGVEEVYKRVVLILSNVLSFFRLYATNKSLAKISNFQSFGRLRTGFPISNKIRNSNDQNSDNPSSHILDRWIIARLHELLQVVTKQMEAYDLVEATRPIALFIDDLSTWYIRRSRDRFKAGDESALCATFYVLHTLSKIIAPFMPFMAEEIYLSLRGGHVGADEIILREAGIATNSFADIAMAEESVHLTEWPEADSSLINNELIQQMATVRKVCELSHALRAEAGVKVRQPLSALQLQATSYKLQADFIALIKDELNVKEVKMVSKVAASGTWKTRTDGQVSVALCTELTEDLKAEGFIRELVRTINGMRKDAGLTISDRIVVYFQTTDLNLKTSLEQNLDLLKVQVLAKAIILDKVEGGLKKELKNLTVGITYERKN